MKLGLLNSLLVLGLMSASTLCGAQTPAKAPGVPAASTRAVENPNEIRVLLAPELETTLVSQIVGLRSTSIWGKVFPKAKHWCNLIAASRRHVSTWRRPNWLPPARITVQKCDCKACSKLLR